MDKTYIHRVIIVRSGQGHSGAVSWERSTVLKDNSSFLVEDLVSTPDHFQFDSFLFLGFIHILSSRISRPAHKAQRKYSDSLSCFYQHLLQFSGLRSLHQATLSYPLILLPLCSLNVDDFTSLLLLFYHVLSFHTSS